MNDFKILGKKKKKAIKFLKENNIPFRIVSEGKINYVTTRDFIPDRINLRINNEGIVFSFYRG